MSGLRSTVLARGLQAKAAALFGPRRPWRAAVLVGLAAVMVGTAFSVDGFKTARLELDESSVWVSNSGLSAVGRINTQIAQVETTSRPHDQPDLAQWGRWVGVVDVGKSVRLIDPGSGSVSTEAKLPESGEVASSAEWVVVHDHDKARAFVTRLSDLGGRNFAKRKGAVAVPADSKVAVGSTGKGFSFSVSKRAIRQIDAPSTKIPLRLDAVSEVAVVGATPVALAAERSKLQINERVIDLSRFGDTPRLQESGGETGYVLVATDSSLVRVPLADGEPTVVVGKGVGAPTRPVSAGGCDYIAWAGDSNGGQIAAVCGDDEAVRGDIDIAGNPNLARFRVNRANVVLNRLDDGVSVMLQSGVFATLKFPNANDAPDKADDTESSEAGDSRRDCTPTGAANAPPVAVPEPELGARAGVDTVLRVLASNTDPDCDVLTIASIVGVAPAEAATAVPVDRATALQLRPNPGFVGTLTISFTFTDGVSAPVAESESVVVSAPKEDDPPTQAEPVTVEFGPGQSVTVNVLDSFRDRNGDPIALTPVDGTPPGVKGTIRSTADGSVTFVDAGSPASFEIPLVVTDGQGNGEGTLRLKLVDTALPVARNDHAVGLVGQRLGIDVLANDVGIDVEGPRLASVSEAPSGTSLRADVQAGLVFFEASAPGAYRFAYTIGSGGKSATAFVRVDITDAGPNAAPVAVADLVSVPVGKSVVVDLLANDSDPNLDVLSVTEVRAPEGSGLTAQLLEHRAVRLTADRPSAEPLVLSYLVSDGALTDEGEVRVRVIASGVVNQPPVARPDSAVVRAGSVVTVAALMNDFDPDGDRIEVDPSKVTLNLAEGQPQPGIVFGSGSSVRFVAGNEPGEVSVTYGVVDPTGASATSLIRIFIVAKDAPNQQPVPRDLEARAVAGSAVLIPIPTGGVDPDGDRVTLSIATAADHGTSEVPESCECVVYTPSASGFVGTDVVTYAATDPGGLQGIAQIRIVVVALGGRNGPPVAVEDRVVVRPGARVSVPVLQNDSDPDQDPLELVPTKFDAVEGVSAKVENDRIIVATTDPGTATFTYTVSDGKQQASNSLTVVVATDAPNALPIARDDNAERPTGDQKTTTVDVLANDEDPDGTAAALTVELADPTQGTVDGGKVSIPVSEVEKVLAYKITDPDGGVAWAVIFVPAKVANLPPTAKRIKTIELKSGESATVQVADIAEDPEGKEVRFTFGDRMKAVGGTVQPKDEKSVGFLAGDVSGEASMTVEVTDGASADDPAGLKTLITVSFRITSTTSNSPPTFASSEVSVERGGDPARVSLRPLVNDPDPGDADKLRFALKGAGSEGVAASLDGDVLSVSAADSTKTGTLSSVTVTVTDGSNPAVEATFAVRVVASTKPVATANEDVIIAKHGEQITIPVLENDRWDPSIAPVKLVSVTSNFGAAKVSGDSVVFTPDMAAGGTATLQYVINDKFGEESRSQAGKITVTVRNRPSTPAPPTVSHFGNKYIVLGWQEPANNGSPITTYEISDPSNGVKTTRCAASTSCKLEASDGVRNDVTYHFTIRAQNEVGWSESSTPSAAVRPDTKPEAPKIAPVLTYRSTMTSGQLEVSWPAPGLTGNWINEGSAIREFELQLTPPPSNAAQLRITDGSATKLLLTGLEDGVAYTAKIRARNNSETDGGWGSFSTASNAESPASAPTVPRTVTATRIDDPLTSKNRLVWSPPADLNAAALSRFEIVVVKNGTAQAPVLVTSGLTNATQQMDFVAEIGATYSYRIRAVNKSGPGPEATATVTLPAYTKPAAVASVSANPNVVSGSVVSGSVFLGFAIPAANGKAIDRFIVTRSPASTVVVPVSSYDAGRSGIVLSGLSNGTSYTFSVQACNDGSGLDSRYCGAATSSNATTPYGPPPAPSVSATKISPTAVRLSWSSNGGNGRAVDRLWISIGGPGSDSAWQAVGLTGSTDQNIGYSSYRTIQAYAESGQSRSANSAVARADTDPPPPPPLIITASKGDAGGCAGCNWIKVSVSGAPANTSFAVKCYSNEYAGGNNFSSYPSYNYPLVTDAAGNGSVSDFCFYGFIGYQMYVEVVGLGNSNQLSW
jgi:hypothetical protein